MIEVAAMKRRQIMRRNKRKFCPGFSLIELLVTISISLVAILVLGVLFVSGIDSWKETYNKAHGQIEEDSRAITIAFGSMGRMANRSNYVIYRKTGSTYTPRVSATPSVDTVVSGDSVEFRYWDVPLDTHDTHHLIDVMKTATAYAFFYLDGTELKIDYGSCPPGAVPAGGGTKNPPNSTIILARNVSADPNIGIFSDTMLNNIRKGSVRINAILTDPNDGDTIRVMTSTFMRNTWPR
jgi:hypothetical protein